MRITDYLYYKLYRATLVGSLKDIAEWAAMFYFSGIAFLNLYEIGSLLYKLKLLPFFFTSKNQVIICIISLFAISYFLFLHKKRYMKIIAKYENEKEIKRKQGNLFVWFYVIISMVLFFIVSLYKTTI